MRSEAGAMHKRSPFKYHTHQEDDTEKWLHLHPNAKRREEKDVRVSF